MSTNNLGFTQSYTHYTHEDILSYNYLKPLIDSTDKKKTSGTKDEVEPIFIQINSQLILDNINNNHQHMIYIY